MSSGLDGEQYIFKESDFEDEGFSAVGFITKYRKVSSLDSLKEQLQMYGGTLKQQLYDIINRDYRDFISIATKLDGVDIRVDLLRKPLTSLRVDIASLHDGMLGSMQNLQDKLRLKTEVATRRRQLEIFLSCYDDVDVIQGILSRGAASGSAVERGGSSSSGSGGNKAIPNNAQQTRREMLLLALEKSSASSMGSSAGLHELSSLGGTRMPMFVNTAAQREVFAASELERAAQALGSLQNNLRLLRSKEFSAASAVAHSHVQRSSSGGRGANGAKSTNTASVELQLQAYMRSIAALEKQAKSASAQLVSYLTQRLVLLLSNAMNESEAAAASDPLDEEKNGQQWNFIPGSAAEESKLIQRSFAHCLRALEAMGQGTVAAKVLAEQLVLPLAKAQLAPGYVDAPAAESGEDGGATSGRGSFASLHLCLRSVLASLKERLSGFFTVAEEVLSYSSALPTDSAHVSIASADLLVTGVWMPVVQLLRERHTAFFSVSIPSTLSRCYRALYSFTDELCDVVDYRSLAAVRECDYGNDEEDDAVEKDVAHCRMAVRERILAHPAVVAVDKQWRLDIYMQLRSSEVMGRIDKACDLFVASCAGRTSAVNANMKSTVSNARSNAGDVVGIWDSLYGDVVYEPTGTLTGSISEKTPVTAVSAASGKPMTDIPAVKAVHKSASLNMSKSVPLVPSLSQSECRALREKIATALPYSRVGIPKGRMSTSRELCWIFAMECLTLTHSTVMIPPMRTECTSLILRLLLRLEAHAVQCGALAPLPSAVSSSSGGSAVAGSTPMKGTASTAATPVGSASLSATSTAAAPSPANPFSSGVAAPAAGASPIPVIVTLNLEELVELSVNILLFENWIENSFIQLLVSDLAEEHGSRLRAIVQMVLPRVSAVRAALWDRCVSTVSLDCKRSLPAAVKAIAAKFRMTNKPPPDAASSYVGSLLEPAQSFFSAHGKSIERLAGVASASKLFNPPSEWRIGLVEDISACFAEQVHILIETGKQMDTALQRRSKIRSSAVSNHQQGFSDYDKIALQIQLDVEAFGKEISRFFSTCANTEAERKVDFEQFPHFLLMQNEVAELVSSVAAAAAATK